jgi:hypothetical protein
LGQYVTYLTVCTTKNPIATVSYIRRWQRIHRRLAGSTASPPPPLHGSHPCPHRDDASANGRRHRAPSPRRRKPSAAMPSPIMVAAMLRPALFATALMAQE